MKQDFELSGVRSSLSLRAGTDRIEIDGSEHDASIRPLGDGEYVLTLNGTPQRVWIARLGDSIFVHMGGRAWEVEALDSLLAGGEDGGPSSDTVSAPMPGTVISLTCKSGDHVKRGDALMAIESMKLQTTITAPRDGVVAACHYDVGATFEKAATLVTLEAE